MKTNILVAVILIIFLVSCGNHTSKQVLQNEKTVKNLDGIKDYGNGVYYFDYTKRNFGKQLVLFLVQHPELQMIAFAADDDGGFTGRGNVNGYFVCFESLIPKPCIQKEQTVKMLDGMTDYGNGVYYFDYTKKSFGEQLSLFIGQHPELQMITFATDDGGFGGYGNTNGYFTYFKLRIPCPHDTIKNN